MCSNVLLHTKSVFEDGYIVADDQLEHDEDVHQREVEVEGLRCGTQAFIMHKDKGQCKYFLK